jgi:hypothetical protein
MRPSRLRLDQTVKLIAGHGVTSTGHPSEDPSQHWTFERVHTCLPSYPTLPMWETLTWETLARSSREYYWCVATILISTRTRQMPHQPCHHSAPTAGRRKIGIEVAGNESVCCLAHGPLMLT